MKARVSEIFKSIQGEGPYQGQEQIFIRFYGCELSCSYCDTKLDRYQLYSPGELLAAVKRFQGRGCLSLTGGEPLEQVAFLKDFLPLARQGGYSIYLETNGIRTQALREIIDQVDIIAMDFKLSSSTRLRDYWRQHRNFLKVAEAKDVFIKAVITPQTLTADIRIALSIIRELKSKAPFILQPQHPHEDKLRQKLRYIQKRCAEYGYDVKTVEQLHKKMGIR